MAKEKNDDPFNLILEEMTKTQTVTVTKTMTKTGVQTGLNFGSLLKSNDKRREIRSKTSGYVDIYITEAKGLTRAVLRNVSPGGVGLEIFPVQLLPNMKVVIEMSGIGEDFGRLNCSVSWVASIDGHPKNHKMIGLKFDDNGPKFKAKFEKYIQSLTAVKRN